MKTGGIYKITSPTYKIYIGQTVDFKGRISDYRRLQCERQPKLYNSLKKHGWYAHVFEVLVESNDADEKNRLERYYIRVFDCFDTEHGLNMADGGGGGKKMSLETRGKMSERQMGNKNHNYGKKASEGTRKLMSEMKQGEKHPNYGKDIFKGEKNGFYNKRHTLETKEAIRRYMKGRHPLYAYRAVIQMDLNDKPLCEYESIADAEAKTGINRSSISACIRGITKQAGVYIWQYKVKPENRQKTICQYDIDGNLVREFADSDLLRLDISKYPVSVWKYKSRNPALRHNLKKRVSQHMDNLLIHIYESVALASVMNNVCASSISNCLRRKTKTAGGFVWKYE